MTALKVINIRNTLKWLLSKTLKPFLQIYYLKSVRRMKYNGLSLKVTPGVFHPGLFFSSKYLADFIHGQDLADKSLLDVGTGSGLLALTAARQGATVVAIDINPQAVANCRENALANRLPIEVIESDLYEQLMQSFDFIVINPPYFAKNPDNLAQSAWYCGENFSYFQRLFGQLHDYISSTGQAFMVLSDGCDLAKIKAIARVHNFELQQVSKKNFLIEKNYIFQIK